MRRSAVLCGTVTVGLVLLTAAGAPAASGPGTKSVPNKEFVAQLSPLNAGAHTVAGTTYTIPSASGTAVITVNGDDITVTVDVQGVTAGTLHPQHIHAGTTCPNAGDDVNHDSFVDVIEGLPKYGPVLISLDSDLNSFAPSLDFPVADASGSYHYSEEASKSHLQSELKQALKLGDRHVVIHGINPTDPLPTTVASLPGLPAWATLPVACGQLSQSR
ncbi:CHRD domain-containing protein [Pseudarthrobacter sp. AL07]|uniref:CHRD domain-containing protein n=1 Tax=unclassified Pseudarthrobacter TaxID=2647000 RepID=UPI00249BE385|nr:MULTISPECIES: CHRD domain-containing protein [unclassified Pseudarthrobacter]MDI3193561.1 CHRD domain-containing protein [Pseudarthrobacter sp. AL20]MDI3207929.1 CHRD domain-containing protein [Pseudarthrobacter sp. AL07]